MFLYASSERLRPPAASSKLCSRYSAWTGVFKRSDYSSAKYIFYGFCGLSSVSCLFNEQSLSFIRSIDV